MTCRELVEGWMGRWNTLVPTLKIGDVRPLRREVDRKLQVEMSVNAIDHGCFTQTELSENSLEAPRQPS